MNDQKIEFTQGDDVDLVLYLVDPVTKRPVDATNLTAFALKFPALAGGAPVVVDMTSGVSVSGDAKLGAVAVSFSATVSATVKDGDSQTVEFSYTLNGKKKNPKLPILFVTAA